MRAAPLLLGAAVLCGQHAAHALFNVGAADPDTAPSPSDERDEQGDEDLAAALVSQAGGGSPAHRLEEAHRLLREQAHRLEEEEAEQLNLWARRAVKNVCGTECNTDSLVHPKSDDPKFDAKKRVITQVNRGRLGNHLFQWAAILSIAKESGSEVVVRGLKYKPEDNAQMRGLAPLVWNKTDYAVLERGPNLCHVWDSAPIIVDTGLPRLSMWSGWGADKGKAHIPTGINPQPGENWAKLWADAMTNTKLPDGAKCDTWELDGFWQQQWFFMDHIDLVREAFWDQPTADKAAEALKWLMYNQNGHQTVGIHIRLGDYKYTNRNMPITYYYDAMVQIQRLTAIDGDHRPISCLIFSDDIQEAMEVTKALEQCDRRIPVPPDMGEEYAFYMMGLMPKIVIADSSFSFWAARLAPHDPVVVAPGIYKDNANAQSAYDYLLQTPGWIIVNTTTDMIDKVTRVDNVGTDDSAPVPKVSALQLESGIVDAADEGAARYARRAMSEWAY